MLSFSEVLTKTCKMSGSMVVCFIVGLIGVALLSPVSSSQGVEERSLGYKHDHKRHFYRYLDVNQDDTLERREYIDLVIQRAKRHLDTERQSELEDIMNEAWLDFRSNEGNNYPESVKINPRNAVEHLTPRKRRQHRIFVRAIFHILDTDFNEKMDKKELTKFSEPGLSFEQIDTNKNGGIDKREFLDLDDAASVFCGYGCYGR